MLRILGFRSKTPQRLRAGRCYYYYFTMAAKFPAFGGAEFNENDSDPASMGRVGSNRALVFGVIRECRLVCSGCRGFRGEKDTTNFVGEGADLRDVACCVCRSIGETGLRSGRRWSNVGFGIRSRARLQRQARKKCRGGSPSCKPQGKA